MRELKVSQGSAAWLECRIGRITASRISDVMTVLKRGGESAARANYRMELLAERLTLRAADHYVSAEMEFGIENEQFARAAYELAEDVPVDQIGFALHPRFDWAGASPDGLVGDAGTLEIKAPKTTTHLNWMIAGEVPEEHRDQMLWEMVCCERQWCDFLSFDPRLPEGLRVFAKRLKRDEKRIAEIEAEVRKLNTEIDLIIDSLGAHWEPQMPREEKTIRIGELDVPEDIVRMLDMEIVP